MFLSSMRKPMAAPRAFVVVEVLDIPMSRRRGTWGRMAHLFRTVAGPPGRNGAPWGAVGAFRQANSGRSRPRAPGKSRKQHVGSSARR